VKDVLTPVFAMLGGQPDFSAIKLGAIGIGSFLNAVISFLLKAAGLYFLIVLPFNRFTARLAVVAPPAAQETLLREIRDLLQQQRR
jgi:large conductance mechanosensitive channel